MPELPEVENIRRTLRPHLLGRGIADVQIYLDRIIKWPSAKDFSAGIAGGVINDVSRRGKYLLVSLASQKLLVAHMRLTGALIASGPGDAPPYARVRFSLSDGNCLWYTDVRTLGALYLLGAGENVIKGLRELGPEPIDGQLTAACFAQIMKKRSAAVKGVLLDQSAIAGVGNIYADEALALAGVMPSRKASDLSPEEAERLREALIGVIGQGIANRGTSFRDYKDGDGKKGDNQNYLLVYGRRGQPCLKCGAPLAYARVAGRGTTYCPRCQK
ncbi:MAG: bifunctional DNA-formamidopyrimidine glycosylase/DNA-(apurinic or apyrimidinic site) lyase [Acidaminococcales bacterium]|jgi:formamidopyrimidine-DNA glycosylase|nr:bifunctional DNA-formamidopyrimidine glycosylase/DNA-(apurinic or apyrimidinic site) lyase [Acidaminococcales bacterium]